MLRTRKDVRIGTKGPPSNPSEATPFRVWTYATETIVHGGVPYKVNCSSFMDFATMAEAEEEYAEIISLGWEGRIAFFEPGVYRWRYPSNLKDPAAWGLDPTWMGGAKRLGLITGEWP